MRKIHLDTTQIKTSTDYDFGGLKFSIADYQNKKYILMRKFINCRGYIGQSILMLKTESSYMKNYMASCALPDNYRYKSGYTYFVVKFKDKNNEKKNFLAHLDWLHKWEKQANVKLSEIVATQDPNIFVVIGSKYWKDSAWKFMLWSFLIKSMCYSNPDDSEPWYWRALNNKKNIDIFLSHIKMPYSEEIFDKKIYGPKYETNSHGSNGFYAIATGQNEPMRTLLGINRGTNEGY